MKLEQSLQALAKSQPIPADVFISRCLYSENEGYYARPETSPGKSGDFFTSVSVGEQFGWLISMAILKKVNDLNLAAEPFFLIEQGAHSGLLANDIISALHTESPKLLDHIQLIFIETFPHLRNQQSRQPSLEKLRQPPLWITSPEELPEHWRGIFYCNELLDAFPVKRFIYRKQNWFELGLHFQEKKWYEAPFAPAPTEALPLLNRYPAPTENEIREWRPSADSWLRSVFQSCSSGMMILFDYGPPSDPVGDTTRAFLGHKQITPWYSQPGQCDITADVDFDHLKHLASELKISSKIESQGSYLTKILTNSDTDALNSRLGAKKWSAWCRRFQTLAHPDHLGHRFQAFTCEKHPTSNV